VNLFIVFVIIGGWAADWVTHVVVRLVNFDYLDLYDSGAALVKIIVFLAMPLLFHLWLEDHDTFIRERAELEAWAVRTDFCRTNLPLNSDLYNLRMYAKYDNPRLWLH
jgi:hypothetical protein